MRILMVSPYPPIRDGIASYAVQEVAALLDEGHDVEVLSPWPSAAHHHLALQGWRGPLALAKRMSQYDKVIVQYHPDIFYPPYPTDAQRMIVTAGLTAAWARNRNVEVRLHEMNFEWGRESGVFGRLYRKLWQLPATVSVHTERERAQLVAATGRPEGRVDVTDHGLNFVPRTAIDRDEARRRLDIDPSQFMFLSIGFVQPHKGFDRAVRAFDGLGEHNCRLDIVGSVRVEEPEYLGYATELRRLTEVTPGAHLHEAYVSDEMFDVWLVAADIVLLPYHFIWSSGVLERAALYGTAAIAMRVGGLEGQSSDAVRLVDDDREMRRAMREAAGIARELADDEPWPDFAPDVGRGEILEAIRSRAGADGRLELGHRAGASGSRPDADLRQLAPLAAARPEAHGFVRQQLKAAVRRLTAWEIDPIVEHVNALQRATTESTKRIASRELEETDPGS